MAVQARHFSHDFPASVGASLFLDDYYACCAPAAPAWPRDTTVLGEFPHSDLAAGCNYAFVPRKRPRLTAAECFVDGQRSGMAPSGVGGLVEVPCGVDVPITSRAAGSGAASTSGRVANGSSAASRSLVSWMHRQGVEIDAVVRLEAERMRAELEEARGRHAGALLAAVCRAASKRLRAAEAELERAVWRNAELEEKARQVSAECHAWVGAANSHEAVAAGLRATLDQLLLQQSLRPSAGGDDAEDAQSCCGLEADADEVDDDAVAVSRSKTAACRWCGGGDACVLVLPCRHLCLCRACEAAVDACPVCAVAKNGSLHVLLS